MDSTYYSRVSQEASSANPMYYIDWDAYDSGEGNPWVLSTQSDYVYERDPYPISMPRSRLRASSHWASRLALLSSVMLPLLSLT